MYVVYSADYFNQNHIHTLYMAVGNAQKIVYKVDYYMWRLGFVQLNVYTKCEHGKLVSACQEDV